MDEQENKSKVILNDLEILSSLLEVIDGINYKKLGLPDTTSDITRDSYLTDMPTDILNKYGLTKTLLTRRETIYLKHVLKNIFHYADEEWLNEKLNMMQFKSQFKYMQFVTDKLRGIYKLPRDYFIEDVDTIVKEKRDSLFKMIDLYKQLNPLIVLDFDKTITNLKFHTLYEYLSDNLGMDIVINSANPDEKIITNYLIKHKLALPKKIFANKGKKKKIVRLKDIAYKNSNKIIFYIDDEKEYLDYGCLLFMYCYEYTKNGKLRSRTIFQK